METMKIVTALSEIKLCEKKIESAQEFILRNLKREEWRKDPFEKHGTTQQSQVHSAVQSIEDNEKRMLALRLGVNQANMQNSLTIEGITRTIAEWIIWKRDVLPMRAIRIQQIYSVLSQEQANTSRSRLSVPPTSEQNINWIYNITDKEIYEEKQLLDAIDQRLDGALSLANANIDITISV